MAQITEDMCEHIIAAADKGERFPLTVNELRQLAYLAKGQLPQKPCDHPLHLRFGSGSLGSDGSSKTETFCRGCGKSWKWETPPREVSTAWTLQNIPHYAANT